MGSCTQTPLKKQKTAGPSLVRRLEPAAFAAIALNRSILESEVEHRQYGMGISLPGLDGIVIVIRCPEEFISNTDIHFVVDCPGQSRHALIAESEILLRLH